MSVGDRNYSLRDACKLEKAEDRRNHPHKRDKNLISWLCDRQSVLESVCHGDVAVVRQRHDCPTSNKQHQTKHNKNNCIQFVRNGPLLISVESLYSAEVAGNQPSHEIGNAKISNEQRWRLFKEISSFPENRP